MAEQFNIGAIPESAPRHDSITKDVEYAYRTLVVPEGGAQPRLENRRINTEVPPFSDYFSETERLGDAQGVQLLKRKFEESSNVAVEVVEGKIFGQVLDGLFYDSMSSVFSVPGAVQVTSEFDDYVNRTDFIVNISKDAEKPHYLLVDTTTQSASDNLKRKLLPKRDNLPNHAGFRQDIKYVVRHQKDKQEIGLKQQPRIVAALDHEGIALLAKKFSGKDRHDFEQASSYIFLSQALEQLERQNAYVKENMTKFKDAGVLIGEYNAYIEILSPLVEEGRNAFKENAEIKNLVKNLPIKTIIPELFPIESDQVASADELAAYRRAYTAITSPKIEKPKEPIVSLGGSNPILRLKKKTPENLSEETKTLNDQSAA